jgi:hypothetical protein
LSSAAARRRRALTRAASQKIACGSFLFVKRESFQFGTGLIDKVRHAFPPVVVALDLCLKQGRFAFFEPLTQTREFQFW